MYLDLTTLSSKFNGTTFGGSLEVDFLGPYGGFPHKGSNGNGDRGSGLGNKTNNSARNSPSSSSNGLHLGLDNEYQDWMAPSGVPTV